MRRAVLLISLLTLLICNPAHGLDNGDSMPTFSLPGVKGTIVDSESLRGNVVVVDFWATWCPPCRVSLPRLADLADRFSGRDVKIVLVSVDHAPQSARELLKELGIESSPNLLPLFDSGELAAHLFDPKTMPTTYVFNRSGRVVMIHHGFKAGDEKSLQLEIESQLNEINKQASKA